MSLETTKVNQNFDHKVSILYLTYIAVILLLFLKNLKNPVLFFQTDREYDWLEQESESPSTKTNKPKLTNILVVTDYRSGSTFLSEIFNQHPNTMYLFEPLFTVGRARQGNLPKRIEILQNFFTNCSIQDLDKDLTTKNMQKERLHYCYAENQEANYCREASNVRFYHRVPHLKHIKNVDGIAFKHKSKTIGSIFDGRKVRGDEFQKICVNETNGTLRFTHTC